MPINVANRTSHNESNTKLPFAILWAHNTEARLLASTAVRQMKAQSESAKLNRVTKMSTNAAQLHTAHQPSASSIAQPGPSSSAPAAIQTVLGPNPHYKVGYLIELNNAPFKPREGWSAGSGQEVDLRLADPNDLRGKFLQGNAFRLKVNPQTGYLMLVAGDTDVRYLVFGSQKFTLRAGSQDVFALYQEVNHLFIKFSNRELHYTLEYLQPKDHAAGERLLEQRSMFYQEKLGILPPDPRVWPVFPVFSNQILGTNDRHFMAIGYFGQTYQGVIHRVVGLQSGDGSLIKEVISYDVGMMARIETEKEVVRVINSAVRVSNYRMFETNKITYLHFVSKIAKPYFVEAREWWYEHNKPPRGFFPTYPETTKAFCRSNHALMPFSSWFAGRAPANVPDSDHALFYWVIHGLHCLHKQEILHRNLSWTNLLVTGSWAPGVASACLGDVGTAISGKKRSKDLHLGHWLEKAPELLERNHEIQHEDGYDQRADVYSMGLAITRCIGFQVNHADIMKPAPPLFHDELHNYLTSTRKLCPHHRSLCNLLMEMLAFKPNKRISAEDALQYECFQHVRLMQRG